MITIRIINHWDIKDPRLKKKAIYLLNNEITKTEILELHEVEELLKQTANNPNINIVLVKDI